MRPANFTDPKFAPQRLKPRFAGSKKCGNGCGATISANKVLCMACFTTLSEEAALKHSVARTNDTEFVESIEASANS